MTNEPADSLIYPHPNPYFNTPIEQLFEKIKELENQIKDQEKRIRNLECNPSIMRIGPSDDFYE